MATGFPDPEQACDTIPRGVGVIIVEDTCENTKNRVLCGMSGEFAVWANCCLSPWWN